MSEIRDILFQLKSLGWKDRQIAERIGTRRDTVAKIRNDSGARISGESFLPMLRELLVEVERQPTRKPSVRTPSGDEQVLDSFLDQSSHPPMSSTVIENTPESDDIRPEIREIVGRAKIQKSHTVQQRSIPQAHIPSQQPLPAPTCAEC